MRVPSRLIHAFDKLSLTELKILFLSLHKKQYGSDKIEIPFDYILKSHRPGGSQYSQISDATEKLMKRVLIHFDETTFTPGTKREYIHFLQYAEHDSAVLAVRQSKEFRELIDFSYERGGYTNINIRSILKLRSWYSARLYLLCCQKLKAGFCSIDYENYKNILNCQKLYKRQSNFINRCLVEPLQEINEQTEIKVKVDTEKRGHRIRKLYFTIAARADRGDIREFLENATAERIEKNYPAEFIKYCLLLTKKIHKPEKGTPSGLFLKILHNNFNKWKRQLDENRKYLLNKNRRPPDRIDGKITREQYDKIPKFARKILDDAGGFDALNKKQNRKGVKNADLQSV